MVMWRDTELCNRATDRHVQLHRGYGHMRLRRRHGPWSGSFCPSIFGGTTEIQKEIIARGLGQ
jgi:alkylation response protein AidB-like acyl-CoA dehydrogenase